MTGWKPYVALVLFGTLALSGVALFVGTVDYDYHYSYEGEVEEFPRDVVAVEYDTLSAEQQRVVDEAVETGGVDKQDGSAIPVEGIQRGGTKYLFSASRSFDWSDPGTFGPTLVGLIGCVGVLAAIRADMKNAGVR
jgi:hypothetical protein